MSKKTVRISEDDYHMILMSLGERHKALRERATIMADNGVAGDYSLLMLRQAQMVADTMRNLQRSAAEGQARSAVSDEESK